MAYSLSVELSDMGSEQVGGGGGGGAFKTRREKIKYSGKQCALCLMKLL